MIRNGGLKMVYVFLAQGFEEIEALAGSGMFCAVQNWK